MDVQFANKDLDRSETDANFDAGFPPEVVKAFRKRMQAIRAALDERAFYAMKSFHFEKLKGNRAHQRSMRLNKQWRLILEIKRLDAGTMVVVIDIEDYH